VVHRNALLVFLAIVLTASAYASESWQIIRCKPMNTAEASGAAVHELSGTELLRVCQDGRLLPDTGFMQITSQKFPDFLLVTQVGAKAREATLYRRVAERYVRIGWWSGWNIRAAQWHSKPAIHYEELEPTLEHPKRVVYFVWNGTRLVPNRSGEVSFHP
jgi:hypothetical protein